jgi:predicted esterase
MRPPLLRRRGGHALTLAAGVLAAGGCAAAMPLDEPSALAESVADTASHEQAAPPAPALPPLEPGPFVSLPVKRHRDAVVSIPVGATTPRPVIVAAHGAGDRPESQCRYWREMVKDTAFVLCPRGLPMNPHVPEEQTGYFHTTHHQLGAELTAALAALAERFPRHADLGAPVYAGFSQGAIMGALLLPSHPAGFSRAVLIEGGYGLFQEWNRLVARSFERRGGERILLACGRIDCTVKANESAGHMRKEGLEARVVSAHGAGHTYGGAVADEVQRALAWVLEGDARFRSTGEAARP